MERSAAHRSAHHSHHASTSGTHVHAAPARGRPGCAGRVHRPDLWRAPARLHALPLPHIPDVDALITGLSHALSLAYEPVVLPCSSMNCGDMVYRSTLDPALRMEQRGINPKGVALLAASLAYLFAGPGVLPGLVDTYVAAPLQRLRARAYGREDIAVGKKIATGGFGTVYRADVTDPESGETFAAIVKKATEFGEAEVWMNERMARASPLHVARFVTAFSDGDGRPGAPLWLVWRFEGASTLAELMLKRDFPANMEAALFARAPAIPDAPTRRAVAIRAAMQQLVEGLRACHAAGIVHRDVKPQNCIVADADRRVKLIDFGAAADLRIGTNYIPNQYLLDPRYAPPQQYIMSSQTPRAPPAPVAAFLSPVLWRLNGPDRFDMWSAGVVLLQMALPPLRTDNGLLAFNRALGEQHGWDLAAWRRAAERRGGAGWAEGFATLDALGGGGWDLALALVRYQPGERLSASGALAHRWFEPSPFGALASGVESLGRAAGKVTEVDGGWLGRQLVRSGPTEGGGFTEASLREELGGGGGASTGGRAGPPSASSTVAWWQRRQSDADAKRRERRGGLEAGLRRAGRQARRTVKEGGRRLGLFGK